MKSACASRSSNGTSSTCSSAAASLVMYGSLAITFMSSPLAFAATIRPIWPRPTTPRVLPAISTPMNFFFSHFPSRIDAVACGICLARASIIDMVCSAVVTVLPSGAFITTMPLAVASETSMLSTPMPALPITFSLPARSRAGPLTLVPLRTAMPSNSPITSARTTGSLAALSLSTTTSMPPVASRISFALRDMLSRTITLYIQVSPPPDTALHTVSGCFQAPPTGKELRNGVIHAILCSGVPVRGPVPRSTGISTLFPGLFSRIFLTERGLKAG